jgi:hypothetical protein
MAARGEIRVAVAGDAISAKYLVFGHPVLLQHALDAPPAIEFDRLIVVVNQMAARLRSGDDPQYDPLQVRRNLRDVYGTEGTWLPISSLVRRLMLKDDRYPTPSRETWCPLIDTELWCSRPLEWRGAARARPVVGRHSRDHYTKWPSTAADLADAYCADRRCEVRLLGGAKRAELVLGRLPENWTVLEFDSVDCLQFLNDVDFFVHYPHEDYIEEFGRAAMEAMAAGCPAILPPVFEETFGPAALYVEPAEVWPTIARLWSDENAYLERARAGREFVVRNCGLELFESRIRGLHEEAYNAPLPQLDPVQ